jgi:hypothetical protein
MVMTDGQIYIEVKLGSTFEYFNLWLRGTTKEGEMFGME